MGLAGAAGWLVFRGLQAKSGLEAAVADAGRLTEAIASGDLAAAGDAVDGLARHSADAAVVAGDPLWRAAEIVPVVGPNLAAVRVAAEQSHVLAVDVAKPVIRVADSLTAGTQPGAILDPAQLRTAQGALENADRAAGAAASELDGVDAAALIQPLGDGVQKLTDVVTSAAPVLTSLAQASTVAPTILGADGPQTILVMVQNNAELRTGGGVTGTFIELRAQDGMLSITGMADSSAFPRGAGSIPPVSSSIADLYGADVGTYVQNVSVTPDFDLTARMASAWWQGHTGHAPDTVISIDPIVLQAILRVTGGVDTPEGPITADDVVDKILVQPYQTLSPEHQTSVFESVATAVFAELTAGIDPVALAQALAEPVTAGRVSVWTAHAAEQEVLAQTALAGPAARQRMAGDDAYAVYLNDATGSKMDTYLDVAIARGAAQCQADGIRTVEISVTLRNTAPQDAGTAFTWSMTGGGFYGTPPGSISTTVAVSAPEGASFGGVTRNGEVRAPRQRVDDGFSVSATQATVAPGETATVTFRFLTRGTSSAAPVILHTPLVGEPAVTTADVACD